MDWTNSLKTTEINNLSNNVVNSLLDELEDANLSKHLKLKISKEEIILLYRWSLYISVNTFTDKLLRALSDSEFLPNKYSKSNFLFKKYNNILDTTLNLYNNNKFNYDFLNELSSILNTGKVNNNIFDENILNSKNKFGLRFFKKKYSIYKKKFFFLLKFILYKYFVVTLFKPKLLYQPGEQLDLIFPWNAKLIRYPLNDYNFDSKSRSNIILFSEKIFIIHYSNILQNIDPKIIKILSKLFGHWIESSISLSLLEGLEDQYLFYNKLIDSFDIKSFHSTTGMPFYENVIIFGILARRRKIKIVSHEHGANNFRTIGKNNFINHYKGIDQMLFSDFFISWGKDKISDKWINATKFNVQVAEIGSVYLYSLKTKYIKKTRKKNFLIYYCASQFRNFITNFEEISPEKNYEHKKNVALFIKQVLSLSEDIKFLYKPFPEDFRNKDNPIYEILSDEIKSNKVSLNNNKSTETMKNVDLVFFDLISTGFAESINIGKPSIIFSTKYEYLLASNEGKKINEMLYSDGVIFYNQEEGINTVKKILTNEISFMEETKESINQFVKNTAYPISKNDFLRKLNLLKL